MIGDRYKNAKTAVLDICKRYLRFRGATDDGVDVAFLKDRVKALEDGRYILVVVGEVKAGKSTFINALLGERILPTDILQSSSAVVEICKAEKKYVEIRYADGHAETVHNNPSTPDLDETFERLRQIGAIQDKYRYIPHTLIDTDIIAGKIKPGRPLPIAELEEKSRLRLQGKETLIHEYVKSRSLADIPEQITFGFPLKYAFDGLRLVDSPGVSARGGVQDATYTYLQEANAVLFVHSLESPVESSSFYDFIMQVVPNRTRETLFLVLTKSGGKPKITVDEKVRQTRRQYDKEFAQHRVLHVDSILKLVSDEIEQFDSAASLKQYYHKQKKHFEAKYEREQSQEWRDEAVNFDIKLRLLNDILDYDDIRNDSDRETVRSELRKLSNFDEMERVIEKFSDQEAPRLQLSELLTTVKHGYHTQDTNLQQDLDLWAKKRKHPQTFENEIREIHDRLDEYQLSMNEFVEKDVNPVFIGRSASYRIAIEQIRDGHIKQITSAAANDAVKRVLVNFHDAMSAFADDKESEIRSLFEDELRRLGGKFEDEYSITVPTVDISGITAKAREAAYRERKVSRKPKGFWEWTKKVLTLGMAEFTQKQSVYDSQAHLSEFKRLTCLVVEEHKEKFPGLVSSLIENFTKNFRSSLKSLIASRNKELEKIKTDQGTNEELLADIAAAEQKKKDIAAEVSRLSDMLGDLQ